MIPHIALTQALCSGSAKFALPVAPESGSDVHPKSVSRASSSLTTLRMSGDASSMGAISAADARPVDVSEGSPWMRDPVDQAARFKVTTGRCRLPSTN